MSEYKHIHVVPFYAAPEEVRAVSTHGGDEDWVIAVRLEDIALHDAAQEITDRLLVCDAQGPVPLNGWLIWITAHA